MNMMRKEIKDIKRPKLKFQGKIYFRWEIIGFGQQQTRHCRKTYKPLSIAIETIQNKTEKGYFYFFFERILLKMNKMSVSCWTTASDLIYV